MSPFLLAKIIIDKTTLFQYTSIMFNTTKSVYAIKPNDKDWLIHSGLMVCPRAGFEISQNCPGEHKWILQQCIENGWLKPVAYISEKEKIFLGLSRA